VKKYAADGTYHHAFHAVSMCSLSNVFSYYFLLLTTRLMVPITMPSTLSFSLSDCLPVRVSLLLSLSPSLCLSLSLSLSLSLRTLETKGWESRESSLLFSISTMSRKV